MITPSGPYSDINYISADTITMRLGNFPNGSFKIELPSDATVKLVMKTIATKENNPCYIPFENQRPILADKRKPGQGVQLLDKTDQKIIDLISSREEFHNYTLHIVYKLRQSSVAIEQEDTSKLNEMD